MQIESRRIEKEICGEQKTNWFCCEPRKDKFWRPTAKEIDDWIHDTYLKFAEQENKDPRRSSDDFLQRYVFYDIYEIFFAGIHVELHEWLSRLTESKTNFKENQSPDWTLERIKLLKSVNNTVSRAVDFQTTRTLEAFVMEFAIDTHSSFSEAERQFFKGPRGKYLNSLSLKIKMLLAKKGILLVQSDCQICYY